MSIMYRLVELQEETTLTIGRNDQGYRFCVGRNRDVWIGFAIGEHADGSASLFLFPELLDGVADRDEAIRRTVAIAQDPTQGYGGIDQWYVGEHLRCKPEEYRCEYCGEFCDGLDCCYREPFE